MFIFWLWLLYPVMLSFSGYDSSPVMLSFFVIHLLYLKYLPYVPFQKNTMNSKFITILTTMTIRILNTVFYYKQVCPNTYKTCSLLLKMPFRGIKHMMLKLVKMITWCTIRTGIYCNSNSLFLDHRLMNCTHFNTHLHQHWIMEDKSL